MNHEGFSSKPYKDNKGNLTIGYGTNIQDGISEIEAELLLNHRLDISRNELSQAIDIDVLMIMDQDRLNVLIEFNYWLGFPTFKKFKNMIAFINEYDFEKAADEMLDSRVGREYRTRVSKLANQLKGL